ncbi:MAG: WD40/YVTN/BNR-like repeat-containing protein [Nitrosopumilaceae archaeon]
MKKGSKSNKGKLIGIGVAVAIAIGVGIAISMKDSDLSETSSQETTDPRIVFWQHVHGLGIDPSDRSILYIATHGDFYHSISGAPPVKVDKIRADYMAFNAPQSPGIPLYSSGHPSTGGNTGLIKSTDGGQTWEVVSKVLEPPVDFHAMALSKSDPNIIIGFDSAARGLFKTADAGTSWETLQYPEYILALAILPTDSQVVFAGTGKGIYKSSDGAKSWTQLETYKGLGIFAMTFDEDDVLYVYTQTFGLVRSSDLGKTWENVNGPALTITSIAVDSVKDVIYVAGHSPQGFQEVYRSLDDGTTWQLIGTNKEL